MKRQQQRHLDSSYSKPPPSRAPVSRQVSYCGQDLAVPAHRTAQVIQAGIVEDWDEGEMKCASEHAPLLPPKSSCAFGADIESVWDKLHTLKSLEECSDYHIANYLSLSVRGHSHQPPGLRPVDEYCREQICEWSYRVVDYFNVNREVVAVALTYLDRFMSKYAQHQGSLLDRRTYKLVATTALYVAIKVHESTATYHLNMLSILANLSRGEFTQTHIIDMEKVLLHQLKFRVHPSTSVGFIHHFMMMPPFVPNRGGCREVEKDVSRQILDAACFYAELAVMDSYFCTERPSIVAVAAILESVERCCRPSSASRAVCSSFWSQVVQPLLGDMIDTQHLNRVQARVRQVYDNFYVNSSSQDEPKSDLDNSEQENSPVSVTHQLS